jgi:hypothetical protein
MRDVRRIAILCFGAVALLTGPVFAQNTRTAGVTAGDIDRDPLRKYLPRDDIFMQVPGGVLAVEHRVGREGTYEEQKEGRNGGLVVGYCLRSSCSHVTHLAVLQVCNNRIGGSDGTHQLILGVVRLPYGDTPGFLMTLQGRDYVSNFFEHGPIVQALAPTPTEEEVESLYALTAQGMGPVAALEFEGLSIKKRQKLDTVALQMHMIRNRLTGAEFPHFEIRHYCRRHVS